MQTANSLLNRLNQYTGATVSPRSPQASAVVNASASSERASANDGGNAAGLLRADAEARANLQRAVAEAGPNAQVNVQYRYDVGPDGRLYLTGGTVTTTERVTKDAAGREVSQSPSPPPLENGLSDLAGPKLGLSPLELADTFGLSEAEEAQLSQLRASDIGVRMHEAQHYRAAGGLANGGPQYDYVQGPDGSFYAVGGAVSVSSTPTNDPQKAARDASTLVNAATAPGDASAQDIAAARGFYSQSGQLFRQAVDPVFKQVA